MFLDKVYCHSFYKGSIFSLSTLLLRYISYCGHLPSCLVYLSWNCRCQLSSTEDEINLHIES